LDDKAAITTIMRRANESLAQCVARGEIQIDKQQHVHPPHKWPIVRETMVRELVYNVVLPQTQRRITFLENESIDISGQVCPIYRLIREIDKYELEHDLRPKTEMKPSFHAAHTGVFGTTEHLLDRTVAKPVKNKKAKDPSVVSANAVDLRPKPFKNNNKSNKQSKDRSQSDYDNKGDKSRNKNTGKYRENNQNRNKSNNSNKSDKEKSYSKEYKDNQSAENKTYYKKGKPKSDNKNSDNENSKPKNKKFKKKQKKLPEFVESAPLLRPRPGQENSFYAKFGTEPYVVTPMKSQQTSEN
jgi:hypothetical protein